MSLRHLSDIRLACVLGTLFLSACGSMFERSAPQSSEPEAVEKSSESAGGQPVVTPYGDAPSARAPGNMDSRAMADFDRAVGLMRAGNTTEAELEFQQLMTAYPQLAAPAINLGLLYRKANRLEQSEEALRTAVQRNPYSAIAWTELGVTLRMQGKFNEAEEAYGRAIAVDSQYAPAFRNLGVLLDLYLGQPERALEMFERYKELSGEDKQVNSWLAELRQRTGIPAPAPSAPASEPASTAEPAPAEPASTDAPANVASPPDAAGSESVGAPDAAGEVQ